MKYIRSIYHKSFGMKQAGDEVSDKDLTLLKSLNIDVSRYTDTKQKNEAQADEPSEVPEEAAPAPKKRTRKKKDE